MSPSYMYVQIADALRSRIRSGEFERGQVLPTETELGQAYGSRRLTIRRSLAILRDEGLLQSRRGFGWFVATRPLEHRLGWLGTIERQIERTGRVPLRQCATLASRSRPGRHVRCWGWTRCCASRASIGQSTR